MKKMMLFTLVFCTALSGGAGYCEENKVLFNRPSIQFADTDKNGAIDRRERVFFENGKMKIFDRDHNGTLDEKENAEFNLIDGEVTGNGPARGLTDDQKILSRKWRDFLVSLESKSIDSDIKMYEEQNARYPDDRDIFSRLINSYVQAGRNKEAIKLLKPLLKKNPSDLQYADMLASVYVNSKDPKECLELYREFAKRNPSSSAARIKYAGALRAMLKYKEALKELEQALALDPDNPDIKREIAFLTERIGKSGRPGETPKGSGGPGEQRGDK